ncbi:MAG: 50S ribosomal protein L33 [Patescibacteria group bacterium]
MAKKTARQFIALECGDCKNRNYLSEKNKTNTVARVELNKFCPHCRKVTAHKETK